ncbi:MAG TPA: hypothetical protein VGM88_11945 [Kofleriaceae bacterium]
MATHFNTTQWTNKGKVTNNGSSIDNATALKFVYEHITSHVLNATSAASAESHVAGLVSGRSPKAGTDTVDLINHSIDGVLQFGDWSVNGIAVGVGTSSAGAWVTGTHPKNLRLLGCITAITQAGANAMTKLAAQLPGVTIWGTTVPLYGGDFISSGLDPKFNVVTTTPLVLLPAVIVEAFVEKKASPEPTKLEVVRDWFERFIHEHRSLDEVAADAAVSAKPTHATAPWVQRVESGATLADLLAGYSSDTARAPGLLAQPQLDIYVPVRAGSHEYARVSYFFNGHMIRIYPCDAADGVIAYRTSASLPAFGDSLPTHRAP